MNSAQAAGSLLRFSGFLLLMATGALYVNNKEVNVTLLGSGSALFIAGLVIGLKHRKPRQ